mgnify:CR=1 FL=1
MKKNFLKTICTLCISGIFLFLAFASGKDNEEKKEVQTNFSSCSEVIDYVQYRGYQSLKEEWGEAKLGHIGMDNSGKFEIEVVWDQVKVNGNTVEFTFTKDQSSNTPMNFVNAYCGN